MNVHIKQLRIKISGVSPEAAREALTGLGTALGERLQRLPSASTSHSIKSLSTRPIHTPADVSHQFLCDRIASSVAHSLLSQLKRKEAP